jgi:hypothetical protein
VLPLMDPPERSSRAGRCRWSGSRSGEARNQADLLVFSVSRRLRRPLHWRLTRGGGTGNYAARRRSRSARSHALIAS